MSKIRPPSVYMRNSTLTELNKNVNYIGCSMITKILNNHLQTKTTKVEPQNNTNKSSISVPSRRYTLTAQPELTNINKLKTTNIALPPQKPVHKGTFVESIL